MKRSLSLPWLLSLSLAVACHHDDKTTNPTGNPTGNPTNPDNRHQTIITDHFAQQLHPSILSSARQGLLNRRGHGAWTRR